MERADKRGQWARVAARLREDVTEGRLGLGDRLAGEIELAERFGVSRGVIQRALAHLRNEGVVMTVHGRGTFVAARPSVTSVKLGSADRLTARLPEDDERERMGMAPGVPLIIISRGGGRREVYDGAVTIVCGEA